MAKLGQVEISTGEPFRWGTGESGDATWSGRTEKSGVYNFKNLTIADNAEILVGGQENASYPAHHSLVIFATQSITFGNNSVINGQRYGSNSGRNDYDGWRQYTPGALADISDPNSGISNNNNSNAVSGGGGGGGAGNNGSGNQGGFASGGISFKYTKNNGTQFVGDQINGFSAGQVASGGSPGNDRNGTQGSDGVDVSTTVKNIIKNNFTYTMKGFRSDSNEESDDFPFATGGDGGRGGESIQTRYGRVWARRPGGGGGNGGACVILVSPNITFPDAFRNADAPDGGYPQDGTDQTVRPGYLSNAAMIYVRGQTRSTIDNSLSGFRSRPGDGASTVKDQGTSANVMSEEGVGGCDSGGTGYHVGMNGQRLVDGGSAGGGGGGGGTCIIIYNKLEGHPTIRCYGGQGGIGMGQQGNNYASSGGNKGGGGGHGGAGYMAIGWKGLISGDIEWVKESNFGMKKGILIDGLIPPLYRSGGTGTPANPFVWSATDSRAIKANEYGPSEGWGEDYSGNQWPKLDFNDEYIVDGPDPQISSVVPQALQLTVYVGNDAPNSNLMNYNSSTITNGGQGYSVNQIVTCSPPNSFQTTVYSSNYTIYPQVITPLQIKVTAVTGAGAITEYETYQVGQFRYWTQQGYGGGPFSLNVSLNDNVFGTLPNVSPELEEGASTPSSIPFTPADITLNWEYYGGSLTTATQAATNNNRTDDFAENNYFARNDELGVINAGNVNGQAGQAIGFRTIIRWRVASVTINNAGGGYTGTPTLEIIGAETTGGLASHLASISFNKNPTTGAIHTPVIAGSGNYLGRGSTVTPTNYGNVYAATYGGQPPSSHTSDVAWTGSPSNQPYYKVNVLNV